MTKELQRNAVIKERNEDNLKCHFTRVPGIPRFAADHEYILNLSLVYTHSMSPPAVNCYSLFRTGQGSSGSVLTRNAFSSVLS